MNTFGILRLCLVIRTYIFLFTVNKQLGSFYGAACLLLYSIGSFAAIPLDIAMCGVWQPAIRVQLPTTIQTTKSNV